MMKQRTLFNFFAALLMFSACSKNENPQPDPGPTPPDPPTPVDSYFHIASEADLAHFLDTTSVEFTDTVVFDNDITVEGTLPCGADFSGVLDGKGHTIKNWKSSTSLFAVNSGKICNLNVDGSCAFNVSLGTFGIFACENKGVLEKLNVAETQITVKENPKDGPVSIGGLAGYSEGPVRSCNSGVLITFKESDFTSSAVGAGGLVGYMKDSLANCVSTSHITLSVTQIQKAAGIRDIETASPSVGGFVGYAADGCAIDGGTGKINIYVVYSPIPKLSGLPPVQVGGVVGSPFGVVSNCKISTSIHTDASYCMNIGGIGGGDAYFTSAGKNSHTDYINCESSGTFQLRLTDAGDYYYIGGIVGWPGREASHSKVVKECSSKADIKVEGDGTAKVRAGGIMGASGNMENCTFSGKIRIKELAPESSAGGLKGYQAYSHSALDSEFSGTVSSQVKIAGVGGLFGAVADKDGKTGKIGTSCKVTGEVSQPDLSAEATGMVVGRYDGVKKTVIFGTAESPVGIAGSINYGDGKAEVNETNYLAVLCGSDNKADNLHTIYAKYIGSAVAADHAEGTVMYDDNQPAVGVAVSNGFDVVYTDKDGKYSLKTSPDVWYIYISLPSDAAIQKNNSGMPDFFYKYNSGRAKYDFYLKRQPVENEFSLFAMADPQAHYEPQTDSNTSKSISDTQRFRDETVPHVNAEVKKQGVPCYGVTLGDIVYSQNTRNSVPGMPVMRENCAAMKIPVFQVMGNHDYTYYYGNDNPLVPDATSSTTHLKAQRAFEGCFGPIDYSFNRGNVHIVCMRNIIYRSTTSAMESVYAGFTDEQFNWLKQDLAGVDKSKKVILCVHIPMSGRTNDHNADVVNLIKDYTDPVIFSGHNHNHRYIGPVNGTNVKEFTHAAVCGDFWWANVEGDGIPLGYYVYKISGTAIANCYFTGFVKDMDSKDYQIRMYRGNLNCGGKYCRFTVPLDAKTIFINVFGGDSRWQVKVFENGVYAGTAPYVPAHNQTFNTVVGGVYTPSTSTSSDWWSIGWLIGECKRGMGTTTSYYTPNYHMFKWIASSESVKLSVEVTDPYGNVYTGDELIENGPDGKAVYLDKIKAKITAK